MNAKTVPDGYPLPALKTFTHKLSNCKVFSKIDLQAAFHNVVIDPQDVCKTTTLTPWGVFVYKRLAFGLCGAPSTFMKLVDNILAGVDGVYAYLDDLWIHGYVSEKAMFPMLEEQMPDVVGVSPREALSQLPAAERAYTGSSAGRLLWPYA